MAIQSAFGLSQRNAFVLDSDIGHDVDDTGAVVVLVKALFDAGVPAEQVVLISSAGGKTEHYDRQFGVHEELRLKWFDTAELRARLIGQVLWATNFSYSPYDQALL